MAEGGSRAARSAVIRQALSNDRLRRALAAYLLFAVGEWGTWIALLVWAYQRDGVRGASALALVQLVPSALLAAPAATWCRRFRLGRALSLGYACQAARGLALGLLLVLDAPAVPVAVVAALGALTITLTRPVHNALVPEISRTTGDLTVGNAGTGTMDAAGTLIGPLLCGVAIGAVGPGGVVLIIAGLLVIAVLLTWSLGRTTTAPAVVDALASSGGESALRVVLRDPAARLLSALVAAEFVLVGMLDILIVVLSLDLLELSDAGPGLLNATVGIGGIVGAALTLVLVGRAHLAPALFVGALLSGLPVALAGFSQGPLLAAVLLLLAGAGRIFFDVSLRTLVQRLLPDRLLTAVFGLQESLMMAALAVGTLAAPLLVEGLGAHGAFVAAALFLPVTTLSAYAMIRRLDRAAVVPSDVFALLADVPILSVLAPRIVERLACDAVPVDVAEGSVVVAEGETGRRFYVIASGGLVVTQGQDTLRSLGPGGWFGEIALLRDVPRTATVTASIESSMWAVERESLLAAVAAAPGSRRVADDYASDHYR